MTPIKGEKLRGIIDLICSSGVLRIHAIGQVVRRLKEQGKKVACERCKQPASVTTGSFFDGKMICLACEELERKHPQYAAAKATEEAQVASGNYNFQGVGLPADWAAYAAGKK